MIVFGMTRINSNDWPIALQGSRYRIYDCRGSLDRDFKHHCLRAQNKCDKIIGVTTVHLTASTLVSQGEIAISLHDSRGDILFVANRNSEVKY